MLGDKKNVFWEALLIAGVVFSLGLILGMFFEASVVNKMDAQYTMSDISLMDMFALNKLSSVETISCETAINANVEFADKIYEESRKLEDYEESSQISDEIKIVHKKYDILRTLLWINLIELEERCNSDVSTVVYIYEYDTEDLGKKATQNVWSRILGELKQEKGNSIILIPVSGNNELTSLDAIISKYNVTELPVVIIDNEVVIRNLASVDDLKAYLN